MISLDKTIVFDNGYFFIYLFILKAVITKGVSVFSKMKKKGLICVLAKSSLFKFKII